MGVDGAHQAFCSDGGGGCGRGPLQSTHRSHCPALLGPLRLAQREGPRQGSGRWSRLAMSQAGVPPVSLTDLLTHVYPASWQPVYAAGTHWHIHEHRTLPLFASLDSEPTPRNMHRQGAGRQDKRQVQSSCICVCMWGGGTCSVRHLWKQTDLGSGVRGNTHVLTCIGGTHPGRCRQGQGGKCQHAETHEGTSWVVGMRPLRRALI